MWSIKVRTKDWEREFGRMAIPKTNKKKILTRTGSFLENQGIEGQNFITLVFKWSLLGVHFFQITSYVDEFMRRQKHGRTAKNCFDNILLHICQWNAAE